MNVAASLLGCPALTLPVLSDEGPAARLAASRRHRTATRRCSRPQAGWRTRRSTAAIWWARSVDVLDFQEVPPFANVQSTPEYIRRISISEECHATIRLDDPRACGDVRIHLVARAACQRPAISIATDQDHRLARARRRSRHRRARLRRQARRAGQDRRGREPDRRRRHHRRRCRREIRARRLHALHGLSCDPIDPAASHGQAAL